jgi:hypothetical protein
VATAVECGPEQGLWLQGRRQPGRAVGGLELDGSGRLQHFRFHRSLIKVDATASEAALSALAERKPKSRTLAAPLKPLKDHLPDGAADRREQQPARAAPGCGFDRS